MRKILTVLSILFFISCGDSGGGGGSSANTVQLINNCSYSVFVTDSCGILASNFGEDAYNSASGEYQKKINAGQTITLTIPDGINAQNCIQEYYALLPGWSECSDSWSGNKWTWQNSN